MPQISHAEEDTKTPQEIIDFFTECVKNKQDLKSCEIEQILRGVFHFVKTDIKRKQPIHYPKTLVNATQMKTDVIFPEKCTLSEKDKQDFENKFSISTYNYILKDFDFWRNYKMITGKLIRDIKKSDSTTFVYVSIEIPSDITADMVKVYGWTWA